MKPLSKSNLFSSKDQEEGSKQESVNPEALEVEMPPQKVTGIGVFMCTLTLLGTRLGGGIVGIPGASKNMGYVTLQCLMTVYACMGMFSIWMLLRVREITGKASYPDLGIYLYGNWSIYFVNALIALAQCGFPIIFFIVFGDVAKGLIEEIDSGAGSFWTSRAFTHTLLAIVMLYLVLKKEIHQLKYAGFALLGLITVFVFLLFIHYLVSDPDPNPSADLTDTEVGVKFFASIPTMIASYSFQPSLFTAFASLKNKTTINGLKAGWCAIWTAYLTYSVTPLLGFGLYGKNVEANLLKNISEESGALPIILQILFLVIAVVHIPIIFFIGKEAVLIIFDEATRGSYSKKNALKESKATPAPGVETNQKLERKDEESQEQAEESNREEENSNQEIVRRESTKNDHLEGEGEHSSPSTSSDKKEVPKASNPKEYLNMKPIFYYVVVLITYLIVVVLSIVVGDVSFFFGIIGSTAGWWIIIAGPASFYIISIHKHKVPLPTWYEKLSYWVAWFYTFLGFSGMIGLNTCVIINAIRD